MKRVHGLLANVQSRSRPLGVTITAPSGNEVGNCLSGKEESDKVKTLNNVFDE